MYIQAYIIICIYVCMWLMIMYYIRFVVWRHLLIFFLSNKWIFFPVINRFLLLFVVCFRGGNPYSYCGLSDTNVCCLISESAQSVNFQSRPIRGKPKCGLKGYDSGRDGFADPSEWPWHVRLHHPNHHHHHLLLLLLLKYRSYYTEITFETLINRVNSRYLNFKNSGCFLPSPSSLLPPR
mgnify:CR=1 FL=1